MTFYGFLNLFNGLMVFLFELVQSFNKKALTLLLVKKTAVLT